VYVLYSYKIAHHEMKVLRCDGLYTDKSLFAPRYSLPTTVTTDP
jgi:hypothetical protein